MGASLLAEAALREAIAHGDERDLLARIDSALRQGVRLNHPTRYESNALVIAVRAHRHEAIGPLVMRGAVAPLVPSDGVDLLMEACRDGKAQLAAALIGSADFAVGYADRRGQTALHHAVQSGSAATVSYLLHMGADPDAAAFGLDADELVTIFGQRHPLLGKSVTPLMMAIALGHEAIACTLLGAGADPDAGGCSPLILAACRREGGMFSALLARGATLRACRNGHGDFGLDACIYARMPVEYLRQLVGQHDFRHDDGSIHSPLGSAVSLGATDTVALLLAHGAPIERHAADAQCFTLWEQALPPNHSHSAVLDLLSARNPAVIAVDDRAAIGTLFKFILDHIQAPEALAAQGIFTSLLWPASARLRQIAADPSLEAQQSLLAAAWELSFHLPAVPPPEGDPASGAMLPHQRWKLGTAMEVHRQRTLLRTAADRQVRYAIEQLKQTITADFFLASLAACPPGEAIARHVSKRIAQTSGAPAQVLRFIEQSWASAISWTSNQLISPHDKLPHARFLVASVMDLLHKAMAAHHRGSDSLADACIDALRVPPRNEARH